LTTACSIGSPTADDSEWTQRVPSGADIDGSEGSDRPDAGPDANRADSEDPEAVGTIDVKVERGPDSPPTLLTLIATRCEVSEDEVRVVGVRDGASITVDTTPFELVHPGTGTWEAEGAAVLTIGDEVFTSDGRIDPTSGVLQRSMFM